MYEDYDPYAYDVFEDEPEDSWPDGDADDWFGMEDAALEYAWGDC